MFKNWWLWCLIAFAFFGIGGAIWTYAIIFYGGTFLLTGACIWYVICLLLDEEYGKALKFGLIAAALIWFICKFFL